MIGRRAARQRTEKVQPRGPSRDLPEKSVPVQPWGSDIVTIGAAQAGRPLFTSGTRPMVPPSG